jgi:DNA-binding transcriptional MerR regulator
VGKKLYYKIGEACRQLEIQPYVLRYWETEFPLLKPGKSKSGQRVYTERELDVIRRIKQLLYDEGFTIAGAKKKLEAEMSSGDGGAGDSQTAEEPAEAPKAELLDSGAEERLEKLQRAVRSAIEEARGILELLSRSDGSK